MNKPSHLALLRGINVGGKNIIRMSDLVEAFRKAGYADVSTYIQSGNVLFSVAAARPSRDAGKEEVAEMEAHIEAFVQRAFKLKVPVLTRTRGEMARVIEAAPTGFGAQPDNYRYDVIYLKQIGEEEALSALPEIREGVDQVWPGPGVLYFSRLSAEAGKSRLSKIVDSPIYPRISIRNWNTTVKLQSLLG